jgi:hypothetical protein
VTGVLRADDIPAALSSASFVIGLKLSENR